MPVKTGIFCAKFWNTFPKPFILIRILILHLKSLKNMQVAFFLFLSSIHPAATKVELYVLNYIINLAVNKVFCSEFELDHLEYFT